MLNLNFPDFGKCASVALLSILCTCGVLKLSSGLPVDPQHYYNPGELTNQKQFNPDPIQGERKPKLVPNDNGQPPCGHEINSQVYHCMVPVKKYAEVLGNSTKAAMKDSMGGGLAGFNSFSNLGQEVFKELCGLIYRFDECVAPARRQCGNHLTLRLMDASYGFLCTTGFKTFYDHADCLMELDQRPEAKKCHDETMTVIENLNRLDTLKFEDKMHKMCRALNYFAGCVKGPVTTQCGQGSWAVIFQVLRDTTQTVMPQCPFDANILNPPEYLGPKNTGRNDNGQKDQPVPSVNYDYAAGRIGNFDGLNGGKVQETRMSHKTYKHQEIRGNPGDTSYSYDNGDTDKSPWQSGNQAPNKLLPCLGTLLCLVLGWSLIQYQFWEFISR